MKKLLTLFTLLLTVCSGAWADSTYEVYFYNATDNTGTQSTIFTLNNISGSGSVSASFKIDGTSYSASGRSSNASNQSITFSLPSGKTGRLWAIHNQSSKHYSLTPSGSSALERITEETGFTEASNAYADVFDLVTSGSYTLANGSSNNIGFIAIILRIDDTTPTSYTVTYNANGGSGTIANSTGTDITLSDGTGFTAPANYSFAGWNTANDGSGTSYAAGQTNVNADLDLFATWTQDGTIDPNTGSANTTYTATLNATSIAIDVAPTKDGHVIKGYYTAATDGTKVANADGTLVASTSYADEDGKWNNSAAAPTLYAQWGEPDYVFTPTGTISSTSLSKGDEVESSTGGKMEFTGTDGTLKYTDAGLEFGSKSACQVTVTLDRLMQVGTKISVTLYNTNNDKERGLVLKNISGTERATMTEQNKEIEFTKTYTVVADDGLAGSNQFVLQRSNNTYLRKVVVTNCVQPKEITITDLSAIEGSTYTGKNYATLYYSDVALAVPSGVKAYTYKMDGEALVVSRTYENGGTYPVIPAGEAVVVESDAGASYNFNVSTTETTVDTNSLLDGTDASTTIDESGYKYYKLAMNDALTSVGFYFAVDGGTSITNGAHKAYLRVSTTASKEYFVLGGEGVEEPQNETDGINAVDIAIANGATIYNLAGQKVGANYKGIVVINGKKVVRK